MRGADGLGQLAHGHGTRHQREQDLDAGGIGEHLEQVGQIVEQLLVGHGVEALLRFLAVASAWAIVGLRVLGWQGVGGGAPVFGFHDRWLVGSRCAALHRVQRGRGHLLVCHGCDPFS